MVPDHIFERALAQVTNKSSMMDASWRESNYIPAQVSDRRLYQCMAYDVFSPLPVAWPTCSFAAVWQWAVYAALAMTLFQAAKQCATT